MNREFELKLQSLLDGELRGGEAARVEAQAQADPAAQGLLNELRALNQSLRGNELERALPESREFFWSKIERAIQAGETAPRPARGWGLGWLWRYWPQLGGATAAAVLLVAAALQFHWFSSANAWEDIENPLSETGAFCFRSEPDRMTLVWVYDRATEPDESAEPVSEVVN